MDWNFRSAYQALGIAGLADTATSTTIFEDNDCKAYLIQGDCALLDVISERHSIGQTMASALVGERQSFGAIHSQVSPQLRAKLARPCLVVDVHFHSLETGKPTNAISDDIEYGFQLVDEEEPEAKAARARDIAASAIMMTMSDRVDHSLTHLGDAAWTESCTKRKFNIAIKATAIATTSSVLNGNAAQSAGNLAQKLATRPELENVVHLLVKSSREIDPLQSFSAAWTALELFCTAAFKEGYRDSMYNHMFGSAAPAAASFINKIKREVGERFNLGDKFTAIATVLADDNALADIDKFRDLNKIRNGFVHAQKVEYHELPGQQVSALLSKYLRLYLERL